MYSPQHILTITSSAIDQCWKQSGPLKPLQCRQFPVKGAAGFRNPVQRITVMHFFSNLNIDYLSSLVVYRLLINGAALTLVCPQPPRASMVEKVPSRVANTRESALLAALYM